MDVTKDAYSQKSEPELLRVAAVLGYGRREANQLRRISARITRRASINVSSDRNIPTDPDAYYETLASQEEIYREEIEEEVRAILISLFPSSTTKPRFNMSDEDDYTRIAETVDEQLDHAAEELITGDSDDPPLSQDAVVEMLTASLIVRRLGLM